MSGVRDRVPLIERSRVKLDVYIFVLEVLQRISEDYSSSKGNEETLSSSLYALDPSSIPRNEAAPLTEWEVEMLRGKFYLEATLPPGGIVIALTVWRHLYDGVCDIDEWFEREFRVKISSFEDLESAVRRVCGLPRRDLLKIVKSTRPNQKYLTPPMTLDTLAEWVEKLAVE